MIVNCGASFNTIKLRELCEQLDEGHDVQIHMLDCSDQLIDFESAHYASELYDIYGDRLQRIEDDTVYHSYKLKDVN